AAVRALEPSDVLSVVDAELQRVEQMLLFLQRAESWEAPALPDLRGQLRKLLVEGSVWDPGPLRDLATVLESSRSTRSAIQKQREAYPLLTETAQHLVELPQQEEAILR